MSTGRKCVTGCALAAQHTLKCVRTKAVAKAVSNFDSHKKRPWIIQKALLFPSFCARFIQIVTFAQLMLKMVFAKSMNLFQKKAFSMNATFNVILGLFKNLLFKNLDLSGSKKKFQNFYSCWPLLFHNVIIHHHQSYPQSTYDYLSRVHCIFKDSHPAFESGHLKQG